MSFVNDFEGKLLEDAIIAVGIGIHKSTLGSVLTKSKVISFGCMSLSCQDNITETLLVGKLTEHQHAKLFVTAKLLDIFVATIFLCEIVEVVTI